MIVKKKTLAMNNVICAKSTMKQENMGTAALAMRAAIIEKGLYPTGPIVYQKTALENGEHEYKLYVSVNHPVDIKEERGISFIPKLEVQEGLCMRHLSEDDDVEKEYLVLEECARKNHMELEKPFFHICMNVYGETVVDIFAPICEGEKNDI
ncbi:DUF5085 family protein [Roseburia sp. 499]|uniref:DUF5085 family protein n=1 Tax=Roseburia sp. 499 TaxID=1261634 RepID=UPI000951AC79|nr:DUF5085 family protein [Roseburia sp. 499]WVK69530.1 DUF5085 family protein [Roseburia sp. 499]